MKKQILIVGIVLAACTPVAPDVPDTTFVRKSESGDALIIADATRALPGYEWAEEEEFFVQSMWDDNELIGVVNYWYSTATERLFTANLTPYSNTEDQDLMVWDEWDELDIHFFGEDFMLAVWGWELEADEEGPFPIETVIEGRVVTMDINSDGEAFIMLHIFEMRP